MIARVDAGDGAADEGAERLDAELGRALLARDHERGGAVVDPARVAGRDRAVLAERGLQARPASRRPCRAGDARRASTSPTATSSSSKRPASFAAAQRCCDWSANASWSSRETPSALGDVLAGLAHRLEREHLLHLRIGEAPAERGVVDASGCRAGTRARACPARAGRGSSTRRRRRRRGRRRPPRSACEAATTADRPDAHSRLTVTPATDSGSPASSAAMRATLRLSSPAWLAAAEVDVLDLAPRRRRRGSTASAMTIAARSSGRTSDERAAVAPDRRADGGEDDCSTHCRA